MRKELEFIGKAAIDYYGEDKVDIQSQCVWIYYPSIRISNELDISHTIREVYVKLEFAEWNAISITLERTLFTPTEWNVGYIHSHCPTSRGRHLLCTGSSDLRRLTSSIPATDDDLQYWSVLFVSMLDKSLSVESIAGGPYYSINNLYNNNSTSENYSNILPCYSLYRYEGFAETNKTDKILWIKVFLKYLFKNNILKFRCVDNTITFADSVTNIEHKVSAVFFDLCNKNKMFRNIVYKSNPEYLVPLGHSASSTHSDSNVPREIPTEPVLRFKGNPKYVRVTFADTEIQKVFINLPVLKNYLIYILVYLNINYGKYQKELRTSRKKESES